MPQSFHRACSFVCQHPFAEIKAFTALWRPTARHPMIVAAQKAREIAQAIPSSTPLLARKNLLEQAASKEEPIVQDFLQGQLGNFSNLLGDYAYSVQHLRYSGKASPEDAPLPTPDHLSWQPAVEAITRLAKQGQSRVVFLNEHHQNPAHRVLTLRLLAPLKALSFTHLALESLANSNDQGGTSLKIAYPRRSDGGYLAESIYAELVREALRLGYQLVAYDAADPQFELAAREKAQANNLWKTVLHDNPKARLIVHGGFGHIYEQGFIGGNVRPMASHFRELSGIDPLTIDQVVMNPYPSQHQHPAYQQLQQELGRFAEPMVLLTSPPAQTKEPSEEQSTNPLPLWSLRPGTYDVTVFSPPTQWSPPEATLPRPSWLSLGNRRLAYPVEASICQKTLPCLVEAYYEQEPLTAETIAADRLVFRQTTEKTALYLRPGKYHLQAKDAEEKVFKTLEITVPVLKLPQQP